MSVLICRVCQKELGVENFGPRWRTLKRGENRDGYKPICTPCEREKLTQSRHRTYSHYLTYLRGKAAQRSKERKLTFAQNLSATYLIELFEKQKGLCAVSKLPLTWTPDEGLANSGDRRGTNVSIDRIDSNGPYSRENVRLVCDRVNKIKSNMSDDDLYFWCAQIASSMRN